MPTYTLNRKQGKLSFYSSFIVKKTGEGRNTYEGGKEEGRGFKQTLKENKRRLSPINDLAETLISEIL